MRFGILGQLEVHDGVDGVQISQGRQRLLLAVLLLHANEPVSRERLVDALWGDDPPPTATRSLHNHVSALRKALGNGRLTTEARGYRLAIAGDEFDAARFDALAEQGRAALAADRPQAAAPLLHEALELWRGPAFGDLNGEDAVANAACALEERRLATVEDRIDADLALGRHAQLVAELDELVAQHPLRERLRGQQMLALYRSGRQADALAAYAAARRYLIDELGIEPGPALRELEGAILQHDPALGPVHGLPAAPHGPLRRRAWRMAAVGALLLIAAGAAALAARRPEPSATGAAAVTGDLLVAIDPAGNRIVERAPVGGTPTEIAVGGGAVWTLNSDDRTISRFDLETKAVRMFAGTAAPVALAAGDDALWVAQAAPPGSKPVIFDLFSSPNRLTRVDPLSGEARETTSLPAPARTVPNLWPGTHLAVGAGAVWTLGRPDWVHRLDRRTARLTTQRGLGAKMIAAGDGQVWVLDRDNRAMQLDPRTGRVIDRVPLPAGWIDALAVGEGSVWLADSSHGTVWRLDPGRGVRTIEVDEGSDSVAAGAGAVWVANSVRGTVSRIDPASNRVTATVVVGGTPRAVAVGAGRVWVAVAGAGRSAPAATGLRTNARVKALAAPPCSRVITGRGGDPDLLIAAELPLGPFTRTTLPMREAIATVLREHRFRAGSFTLGYQSCDDANPTTGYVDKCRQNARMYLDSPDVVGIVGPFDSSCARDMLPILSRAGDEQPALVSPTNSDPELVRSAPRALADLYPTGQRGYARVFPSDDYDVAAGAMLAHRLGDGRVFFLQDRDFAVNYPRGEWFRRAAAEIGLRIVGWATWRVRDTDYRDIAERVRASGVRAVYVDSGLEGHLGRLLRDLRAAVGPDVAIIGWTAFGPVSQLFADAGAAARGVLITSPGLTADALGVAGRRFVERFGATQPGGRVSTFDIYAAAATEVLLDAIARSDGTRASVVRALRETRLRDSVIGPLSLGRNGEPSAQPITVMRVEHDRGRADIIQNLDGAVPVSVITPPARLAVGAEPSG